ncbi:MAG: right-handed parallel beta-helix repeat-containing protein [Bacteroidaceae bacterium]|nr:right-handed parallel beta-helix repeat-containing protein [Bacteroidaceae bacterium]
MKQLLTAIIISLAIAACSNDDKFSISTADKLTFALDTVKMDTVFSKVPAPTKSFWIYNRSSASIRCSKVMLEQGNQTGFRVNVDGEFLSPEKGYALTDIEVRKGDSIRVFVEITSPEQGQLSPKLVSDNLVFNLESGAQQKVNLNAWSWDAERITNLVVKGEHTLSAGKPIIIYGGIKVDSASTLYINEGTTIYFHDGAGIDAYGKVISKGTAERPVTLRGDRLDRMFDYLPYDLVSGLWKGIHLYSSSMENEITFTDIHSTYDGVVCDSSSLDDLKLDLAYSTIHNCHGYGLKATHSVVNVTASQITNSFYDCVSANGGFVGITNCTIAQYYPFGNSLRGMALRFTDQCNTPQQVSYLGVNGFLCINTIITGFDNDVIMGEMNDTTNTYGYKFQNCVLTTPEVQGDSVHFENVQWKGALADSTFVLISHETQHYDFHLDTLSCAVGAAEAMYLPPHDRDGKPYNQQKPDIGCYSLSTSPKSNTKSFARRKEF